MAKEGTILKLKKVFSMGYVPSRGAQSYSFVSQISKDYYFFHANCFSHACLNLTNELIDSANLSFYDSLNFSLGNIFSSTDAEYEFTSFLQQIGLTTKFVNNDDLINDFPCFLNENQWIVALYFCENSNDFHFFLQEKDGSWSGKYSYKNIVEHFDELPCCYTAPNVQKDKYYFINKYLITNPHAKTSNKEENEYANC
ncbi:MAG: hypothetical protein E7379_03675 [Clostridiales bacterium]|nr:hypothetical protein [Clostridiales bacterium]